MEKELGGVLNQLDGDDQETYIGLVNFLNEKAEEPKSQED
jgi:hypothetical protein